LIDNDAPLNALREVSRAHPDDPLHAFQLACECDGRGLEREAIPHYARALANGLAGDDRQMAFINLGSSYRAVGEYEQAVAVWREGLAAYPENRALTTFLAIGLYNLGEHATATELLLTQLAETSDDPWITRYRRAILFYAAALDQTW
jgi:tetratricopeptide (TPR) repeat protein